MKTLDQLDHEYESKFRIAHEAESDYYRAVGLKAPKEEIEKLKAEFETARTNCLKVLVDTSFGELFGIKLIGE